MLSSGGGRRIYSKKKKKMDYSLWFYRDVALLEATKTIAKPPLEDDKSFPATLSIPGKHPTVYATLSPQNESDNFSVTAVDTRVKGSKFVWRKQRELRSENNTGRKNMDLTELGKGSSEDSEDEENGDPYVLSLKYTDELRKIFGESGRYYALQKRDNIIGLSWKKGNEVQFKIKPETITKVIVSVKGKKKGSLNVSAKALLQDVDCRFENELTFPFFADTGAFVEKCFVQTNAVVTFPGHFLVPAGKKLAFSKIRYVDRALNVSRAEYEGREYSTATSSRRGYSTATSSRRSSHNDLASEGNVTTASPSISVDGPTKAVDDPTKDITSDYTVQENVILEVTEESQRSCYRISKAEISALCSTISWILLPDSRSEVESCPKITAVFQNKISTPLGGRSVFYMNSPPGTQEAKTLLGYGDDSIRNLDHVELGKDPNIAIKVMSTTSTEIASTSTVTHTHKIRLHNTSGVFRRVALFQKTNQPDPAISFVPSEQKARNEKRKNEKQPEICDALDELRKRQPAGTSVYWCGIEAGDMITVDIPFITKHGVAIHKY